MNSNNGYDANELYEEALRPVRSPLGQVLAAVWFVVGIGILTWFCWAEPFSAVLFEKLTNAGAPSWLITYVLAPLWMAFRGVLMVEVSGYWYHRFFQHVGFFTRLWSVFRKNQRFHWIHHMVIYPIGRFYKRPGNYKAAEESSLSWIAPGVMIALLFVITHGFSIASLAFLAGIGLYAWFVIDLTHERFHLEKHPWQSKRYFQWLEEIHLLHHWDQRRNYTIVHPAMDWLFGTYLSPRKHARQLAIAKNPDQLTASDVMNWEYLLTEATPAEYAAYVSNVRGHRPSLDKVNKLLAMLETRTKTHPEDAHAAKLLSLARDLTVLIQRPPAQGAKTA